MRRKLCCLQPTKHDTSLIVCLLSMSTPRNWGAAAFDQQHGLVVTGGYSSSSTITSNALNRYVCSIHSLLKVAYVERYMHMYIQF